MKSINPGLTEVKWLLDENSSIKFCSPLNKIKKPLIKMSGPFTTLTNLSKHRYISKFTALSILFNGYLLFFGAVPDFLFLSASVCAGFVAAGLVAAGFVAAGFELVFVVVFVFVVVSVCFAGVVAGDTELTELLVSFLVTSFF